MTEEERRLVGTIIEGPTPDEQGNDVIFKVKVGDEIVVGVANPLGVGWRGEITRENLSATNATRVAISAFIKGHEHEMLPLYREAARLRREKGYPPPHGNTRRGRFALDGPPTRAGKSVRFTARSTGTKIDILIFREGGFIDHCDDWESVSDADRDEAITAMLDYIFAHPEQATDLGLDVSLLEELWR